MNITKKRSGSKRVDMTEVASLFARLGSTPSLAYGVVFKPPSESSHAEIEGDDVLVHVQLMPHETPILCRLFTAAAGAGSGLWKVPKPGAEVLVAIPGDDIEHGPVIVAVSPSGTVPSLLDEDTLVIENADGLILVGGDDYAAPKWDDFLADLKQLLGCIGIILASNCVNGAPLFGTTVAPTDGSGYATNALELAALVTRLSNVANYKSSKVKNG